jgi:DNA (cytosine-5)-methyltransferase 1
VPKWRDIRDVTDDAIRNAGIGHITVLSGGFPCQPFSNGGKRRGKADDRFLWPEMLRVIKIAGPDWIIGENVAGIIDMELDNVLSSLEDTGYSCRAFCVPACGVQAPHQRFRVFIIANNERDGRSMGTDEESGLGWQNTNIDENTSCVGAIADIDNLRFNDGPIKGQRIYGQSPCLKVGTGTQLITDADSERLQGYGEHGECAGEQFVAAGAWEEPWIEVATRLCRVDDGVSRRVDRLRALGNAVVPQQAFPFFKAIAEIEGIV